MSDQIKEKAKKIEFLYREYLKKMDDLKVQQNSIIDDFVKKLEEAKIAEIRKKLK